jgi:hypothetical protein
MCLYDVLMMRVLPIAALLMMMALPAWGGGSEEFDPDQPFREAVTKNLLRSWLNQALDMLDDHLEITGTLAPNEAGGDRRRHLRFKFYPDGKSTSEDSITAEGWVDRSPDGHLLDLHFRFTLPDPSSQKASQQFDYVL